MERYRKELLQRKKAFENEERRLFYVAVTRAKDLLYLCNEENTTESEFIAMMDRSVLEKYPMRTSHEDQEFMGLRDNLRCQIELDTPEDDIVKKNIDKMVEMQSQVTSVVEQRLREYEGKYPYLAKLDDSAYLYWKQAVTLIALAHLNSCEFYKEIVHNMHRCAEENLVFIAGSKALLHKIKEKVVLRVMTNDLSHLLSQGGSPAPSKNYIKNILTISGSYNSPLYSDYKELKKGAIIHYVMRSGRYDIPHTISSTWNHNRFYQGTADDFLIAAKDLANLRNVLIHDVPSIWPEEPIGKALNCLIQIVNANTLAQ